MRTASAILGVVLCAGIGRLAGAAEQGNVYVWTDKDGTPHYQDRPPEGNPEVAKELSLRYKLTDGEAIAAASKHQGNLDEAKQVRETQQAQDKSADQADKTQVINEHEKGCADARARLEKYDTAHRLYKPGPDGKRTYLTDEETDAARAAARQDVDEWCGG